MKGMIKYTLAATLVAGAAASGSHHQHLHRHVKKEAGSKVIKREPDRVTEYVVGATETVYKLGDEVLDAKKAKAGLHDGAFVVVGESTPIYSPPPPLPKPKTTSTAVPNLGAQFLESKTSSTTTPTPITTSVAKPTSTSTPPPPPPPSPKPKPTKSAPSPGSGTTGLNAKFPSGKVKCSEFPSQYGAVPLDWLNTGGWSSIQYVPSFSPGDLSISNIITAVAGEGCRPHAFCSYACPPGQQKAQWPKPQGSTKQSVGGLYCNANGYLELTREGSDTLCELGVGGVVIQNDLDEVVSTCRTEYPGNESMVIPAIAEPGSQVELCNPDQTNYYVWDGMATSAQYYLNKKGLGAKDACCWTSPNNLLDAGNWAPIIIGVGKAADGITYLSVFPNAPTTHAKLDFNVEITGDVNSECGYENGQYKGGPNGCTTGMQPGGKAVIRYY